MNSARQFNFDVCTNIDSLRLVVSVTHGNRGGGLNCSDGYKLRNWVLHSDARLALCTLGLPLPEMTNPSVLMDGIRVPGAVCAVDADDFNQTSASLLMRHF
jgi:hypothetical protein